MSLQVHNALSKLFQKYRIIFWYDDKGELAAQFDEINLSEVEKLHVINDEFYIKYHILKEKPLQKFLLYFTQPKPEYSENWLLDVELANYEFRTDQASMYLQELGLDYHFKDLISEHYDFFKSKERRIKLKEWLEPGDEQKQIREKMLGIIFGTEEINLTSFLLEYANSEGSGSVEKLTTSLDKYNLSIPFWREVSRRYQYSTETPSIYDFLIEVFRSNSIITPGASVNKESKIFLSRWKGSIAYQDSFKSLSKRIANDLGIKEKLDATSLKDITKEDLYSLIDLRIISELAQLVINSEISHDRIDEIIKQRENKFYYQDFNNLYQCLSHAVDLFEKVLQYKNLILENSQQVISLYSEKLYEVDFHYRKFIWFFRKTNQNRVLDSVSQKVEKVYSNDWLFEINNSWQKLIDKSNTWEFSPISKQNGFYNNHIKPMLTKGQRLFVIISDALRYEAGQELYEKVMQEKRYDGDNNFLVSSLPSYTQLGMAALLPHQTLTIKQGSDQILLDGQSTQGIEARKQILEAYAGAKATAITAEDFMRMNAAKEGRDFVKNFNLIYIYHNQIDKLGDDKSTEEKVFDAVEAEIEFLMSMLRKIANMNGTNIFITSDHGFLYQNHDIAESDFSVPEVTGEIWKQSRRFIIGKTLKGDNSLKEFKANQIGLDGDFDILIPKSISRLRVKGSGSRFVHGGASLQEIVVPLLKVTKKRQDTTEHVEIDIIKSTDKITTSKLVVSFIQTSNVSEKVLPRIIRAAIYTENGKLLSDFFNYEFNITDGTERHREVKHGFNISADAKSYRNQRVKLVLEEPVEGAANKWKTYKEFYYTLMISFTNDFDNF